MSNDFVRVKDVMIKKVITLGPEDDLSKATKLFDEYNYDGFPVVNEEGILLGLVTAYDMVSQSYATHLPSLLNNLDDIYSEKADSKALREQFEKVGMVKVRDIMNEDPLVVMADARLEELAKEFIQHHRVNPILVIDADKKLLGVVSRLDILRFFDAKFLYKTLEDAGHGGILKRLERFDEK